MEILGEKFSFKIGGRAKTKKRLKSQNGHFFEEFLAFDHQNSFSIYKCLLHLRKQVL